MSPMRTTKTMTTMIIEADEDAEAYEVDEDDEPDEDDKTDEDDGEACSGRPQYFVWAVEDDQADEDDKGDEDDEDEEGLPGATMPLKMMRTLRAGPRAADLLSAARCLQALGYLTRRHMA